MGTRILRVDPSWIVELAKSPGDRPRSFIALEALPGDAKVVGGEWDWAMALLRLRLESSEWDGDSEESIQPPLLVRWAGEATP